MGDNELTASTVVGLSLAFYDQGPGPHLLRANYKFVYVPCVCFPAGPGNDSMKFSCLG